jgi:aminopeptidase N
MEYDGATTGSEGSLEHEVFHSWFGRGVKPASARDGWIDEALATWWTSDHPDHPRQAAMPLALDGEPVVLAPPSPWSRHTPREAYRTGYRLMAGIAHAAGGAARLTDALTTFYRRSAGGFASTDDLHAHLSESLSVDLSPWWDRYVRGIV